MNLLIFEPLIRGPFWGCVLLSVLLSIIGTLTFHAKKPLAGEVLSHCSFPGAIIGLFVSIATYGQENPVWILFLAFISALAGSFLMRVLQKRISADSAMTLVLSGFFGLGIVFSSVMQQLYPKFFRLAQGYLFGQISTMTDIHIWVYSIALLIILALFFVFFDLISLNLFDQEQSMRFSGSFVFYLIDFFICLAIVLGIRGIGVVLVSSFFVAPAAIALRFAKTFKSSLLIASVSALSISIISFNFISKAPLGPLMVLLLSLIAFLTLRRKSHVSL